MPYVKISPATKKQAMEKLAAGMSMTDVAKMFSISSKTLSAWQNKTSGGKGNSSLASTPSQASTTPAPSTQATQDTQQVSSLDFEESPAPPGKKNAVDSAWASLKGMLGIADKGTEKAAPPVLSAKLDAKRQQFVDAATPTLSLAFMALASWLWAQVEPDYSGMLAPDEKTAQRIVEPLLRVYARHANFLTDVSPDVADIGASMFAIVGYINASYRLYRQIKEEEQHEESPANGNTSNGRWRAYRPAPTENGTGNTSHRQPDVHGASRQHGSGNGANGRDTGDISGLTLSEQEARQYAALSRLSQLDYNHRARRSGRP